MISTHHFHLLNYFHFHPITLWIGQGQRTMAGRMMPVLLFVVCAFEPITMAWLCSFLIVLSPPSLLQPMRFHSRRRCSVFHGHSLVTPSRVAHRAASPSSPVRHHVQRLGLSSDWYRRAVLPRGVESVKESSGNVGDGQDEVVAKIKSSFTYILYDVQY